jgi:hypothetical protein
LVVSGLTNSTAVDSYTSQFVTYTGTSVPNDSAVSGPISFTAGTLASPTWTVSRANAGATGVTYNYSFATVTANTLSALTMTVPPGTAGTPSVSIANLPGATIALSGQLLTITAPGGATVPAGYPVAITVTGLTNTSAVGNYTSQIVTIGASGGAANTPLDSGSTAPVAIA